MQVNSIPVAHRAYMGAKLLDRLIPGWWRLIDIHTLNIADPFSCIWGQIHGGDWVQDQTGYGVACTAVRERKNTEEAANDFMIRYGFDSFWGSAVSCDLTVAWINQVNFRRYLD